MSRRGSHASPVPVVSRSPSHLQPGTEMKRLLLIAVLVLFVAPLVHLYFGR